MKTEYDDIDRPVTVTSQFWDTVPNPDVLTDYSLTRTAYRANGQVERVSDPAAPSVAEADRTWNRTEYDAGGRADRSRSRG